MGRDLDGEQVARERLRAVLDDAGIEEGRHWYRLLGPAGELYAESSNPMEIGRFAAEATPGCTTEVLRCYIVRTPWEPWEPPAAKHG